MSEQSSIDLQPFIEALKDQDQYIRLRATEILGRIGDSAAVPALINAMYDPDNSIKYGKGIFAKKSVQNMATDALVAIGGPVVIEALETMLIEGDKQWRIMAIFLLKDVALGSDEKNPVIKLLQNLLTDDDLEIRTRAIEALRDIIFEGNR